MMMMEVETAAREGADPMMDPVEDEEEMLPPSSERHEEEEDEGVSTGVEAAVGLMDEEEGVDPPPVRIIPIPAHPVQSCSPPTASSSVKSAGAALGFMVNGRPVPPPPGGGGMELKLCSHPGGSASGFTTVQIPVTLTLHSPAGTHHINTTASLTATVTSSPHGGPEPTPIITGVVSGEAAQKVLSDHNVKFRSSPSPRSTPPAPRRTNPPPSKGRATQLKLLRKGELGPVLPPNCVVCQSQYKLITELRGFMCLCSPALADSLKNLKNKKRKKIRHGRRSRAPRDPQVKPSRPRPGLSANKVASFVQRSFKQSDDVLSDELSSPVPPSTICSPLQLDQSGPPPEKPQGKLVILVEDFYYGSAPGNVKAILQEGKYSGPYQCIHCPKILRNNIKLMHHMQHHVSKMSLRDGGMDSVSCPHCFRHFLSPFQLQCHLEVVHSQCESTVTCKICELAFHSEPAFLWHMKNTHKPGEMPYACQVCDFRSSFYSDVWSHFQEFHADTRHLLCQYCFRVLRSYTCYQQHFARHQRKHVISCDKCRLHFLYVKERAEHRALHHRTHVRPPQLSGLKPGTKVTVRTYSVVGGSEGEGSLNTSAPCKVVDVVPPPVRKAPKRKPVESLGTLLSSLSPDSVCLPPQRCLECLSLFPDFRAHFPSLVHCSLCRFITCCSTSYANHMINNHATCRRTPQYQTMFQAQPRLAQTLRCSSCPLSTCRGDVMANHLTETPGHTCVMEGTAAEEDGSYCERQSVAPRGGAFIPIHLVPSHQTSSQLSIKALTSPSPLSCPPAMTIKFLGPRPQPGQPRLRPLSVPQLSVVLSSLCHGVSQASQRYLTPPGTIVSWTEQHQQGLTQLKWWWRTDTVAEWVLRRREQQLSVDEDVLLLTAKAVLGEDSPLVDSYSWTVDFLLRHELGVNQVCCRLPRSVQDRSRSFIQTLCSQLQGRALPSGSVGCMDEFPVFVDPVLFSNQDPLSYQMFGSPEDRPMFDVVLSSLSDGSFLPPLLFIRGTAAVPEGFPDNVLLEARREGFTDRDRLHLWVQKVWRPHVTSQCNSMSLLLVDVHRGHLTDHFKDELSSVSTDVVFIPSGCCCRLQPLNVCVTPVLRNVLQARWSQLVSEGGLDGLGLDQLALTLACWLSEVSSTLNSDTGVLQRLFSSVCSLQHDGEEAVRMTRDLTKTLIQPPESRPPGGGVTELLLLEKDLFHGYHDD